MFSQLVNKGGRTAFGREHGFDKIGSYEAFKAQVPLRDYEALRPWIERIKAGERDILWPGLPKYFAKTSGTTSGVKVPNFVNQQVGHSEATAYGRPKHQGSGYGCGYTHTVVAGESLFGIGRAYGVSGSAMLSANPWIYSRANRYVFPGDSVCIP